MFKVTRLLWLTLSVLAWATTSLSAQTFEVNLSTTTFVNVNLDDDCSREVIYRNLLNGDFDVDGDGIFPPESAFTIEIDDLDPDNGNVVDGCGTYSFTITPTPGGGVVGFTSGFGSINASDITPPAVVGAPVPNGPFFTTQLNELTINTLPFSVSREFVVNGETTFPNMSTMENALLMRLIAGGEVPRFSDACSDVRVTVSDAIATDGDCGDIVITRTFVAEDFSDDCNPEEEGNTVTTLSYDILLQRPSISNVIAPPALATYECDNPDAQDGMIPAPAVTDFPFLNGPAGPIYLTENFGNVAATFSDGEIFNICDDTYKFVRTYTVIDWCDPENTMTFTQLVKVGDTGAPTIVAPQQDLDFDGNPDSGPLVFSTNAPGCGAFIPTNTGGLLIEDGCGSVATVTAFVLVDGEEDNQLGPIDVMAASPTQRLTPFLPAGPHTLRYVAADACGNESTVDLDIVIEDRSGPVVIAEDALNVALSNAGFAEVQASDIDAGSYDDCTEVTVEIAFANPSSMLAIGSFGPSITLTCIDVGAVPVILRVTDANGNSNQRMSIINVVDNSAPVCIAPGDMTLDCTTADSMLPEDVNVEFANDPNGVINLLNELFGEPASLDNCGNELVTQSVVSDINDCGQGTLTRSFEVTDARGFTSAPGCNQLINIGGIRNYTIIFPADEETTCGADPQIDIVMANEFGCDLLVTTMHTDTFVAAAEECFKLRRTIEVLNWCEYNGIDEAYTIPRDADADGSFLEATYLHVIPGNNANPTDDRAILDRDGNRNNNNSIGPLDIDDNFSTPTDSDNDGDTGFALSESRGFYRYVQFVKVYDNEAPTITNIDSEVTAGTDCEGGDVTINYSVLDDCVQENVTSVAEIDFDYVAANGFNAERALNNSELTSDGNASFSINLEGVRPGRHAIRVRGLDGCGNSNGRVIPFDVVESGSVDAICISVLTFVLMPDGEGGGMAVVEADDFVIDATTCNAQNVSYSIYRDETETGQPGFVPQPGRTGIPVTCSDEGNLPVQVYTFDASGNFDVCTVTAIIQPFNDNVCSDGGLGSLAGFVTSPFNELLSDIEVHITDHSDMEEMQYTDENGSFLFPGLSEGGEYMVRPEMGDAVNLQRVKTSDINKLMNHIMGADPITNPYLLVAADVDADGYITVGDMVGIRRVILGLDETFPFGPTYRFIRRDFNMEGLAEGWDPGIFPSTFTVEELDGHNRDADFIAVEVGDVYIQADGRSQENLLAADAELRAGEHHVLTLTAGDLRGFQGTIAAEAGLRIESWASKVLGAGNVNDRLLADGLLAVSFDDTELLTGEEVITLELRADRDLRISDYLSVSNAITAPEAITAAGTSAGLGLFFRELTGGAGIMLHQNFPNPVAAQTTITFELPTAATVTLDVHDVQGRLLSTRNIDASAGSNSVILSANDDLNNTTGLLSYTLTVGRERLTKRMTVVAR